MTNHTELADCLSPPAWMASLSLDLQDACLHIPIRKSLHRYLAFILDNQLWFFKALPFGLSPAPALFTGVLRWPLSLLQSQGVHVLAYLDDWILWASSSDTLREHVRWTCTTLSRLGWIINRPKSHLSPSMDLIWLGVRWLPQLGRWELPPDKVREISQLARALLTSKHSSQRNWEQFVGKLVFATQVLRHLQPLLQPLYAPRCFSQLLQILLFRDYCRFSCSGIQRFYQ